MQSYKKLTLLLSALLLLTAASALYAAEKSASAGQEHPVILYFFWGKGCPHCEKEKLFLAGLKKELPLLEIRDYEVWRNKQNAKVLAGMLQQRGMRLTGVPVTIVGSQAFVGFNEQKKRAIETVLQECRRSGCPDPALGTGIAPASPPVSPASEDKSTSVDVPFLGKFDARNASLPVLTVIIAGMDSFNPCAFFVLLSLLGLLVHARSRNRMFLIGAVFVGISGIIYFLFMAAWLNLFLFMGQVAVITTIAGFISVVIALINIKDFFIFKQGPSLTIPDSAKPKLFDRMRKLVHATSLFPVLAGTAVLAIAANSYELLCTAGFPLVYTRILTLRGLQPTAYYLYLALYNIVYVIPLFLIVVVFTISLGSRKLTEWQGRVLKLVSGMMMLGLGLLLLIKPELLNSIAVSFSLLAGASAISYGIAKVAKKPEVKKSDMKKERKR